MITRGLTTRRKRITGSAPRVGLFGLLGSGNLGNDGSLEAVLTFLRERHPDAILDFLCAGPEQVTSRYGIPATRLNWYRSEYQTASGPRAVALKAVGKAVDAVRTARWVRRHDVVIVPGMGVLEATLPLRPWGFPYSLFLLGVSGRLAGTKVALVSVGANVVSQRLTRWLITSTVRLAHYRSYRDSLSRDAVREMGVDSSGDRVYPDLVFAYPTPRAAPASTGAVGVGVMAYHGGNDDRRRAGEIHAAYVDTMKRFVRWLVDNDRPVRLFTGDHVDESVVAEIRSDLRAYRPDLKPSWVLAESVSSLDDIMAQMSTVDTVVATRYHNVLCALKLAKPTLSLGYAAKNDVLMASMGLGEFCQSARSLDLVRLIEQFIALESRREQLTRTMVEQNLINAERLEHQYALLSATLFPASGAPRSPRRTGSRTPDSARSPHAMVPTKGSEVVRVLGSVFKVKAGPRAWAQVLERSSRDDVVAAQYDVPGAAAGYSDAHEGPGPAARFFRSRIDLISRALASSPGGDLLDVGCGPGMMVHELLTSRPSEFRITALDRSPDMVQACELRAGGASNVRALVGRVEAMPFPDASFDVVLAMGVLEYADPAAAFAEITRIVRPDGLVLVTMLNPMSPYRFVEWYVYWPLLRVLGAAEALLKVPPERRHGPAATGIRAYRERKLCRIMATAGLRPVQVEYFDVTFLVPPLERLVRRWSRGQHRPERSIADGWRKWLGTAYLVVAHR